MAEPSPKQQELLKLLAELNAQRRENMLANYHPTPKQIEFHTAGIYRERLLMAANQSGKTMGAGAEVAYHMTGEYPKWWKGRRFHKATIGWALGPTNESTRDNPQRMLLGRAPDWGTGMIPKKELVGEPTRARGVADAIDSFRVRHRTGGISQCYFKSYERGREKLQGETLDWAWLDEEPPAPIYMEIMTRTNRRQGPIFITASPLKGITEVIGRFLEISGEEQGGAAQRRVIQMDLRDATFYTTEEVDAITAQYPDHEKEARVHGNPAMGSGVVYPIPDEQISVDPFAIPAHFRRICGLDVGIDHPTAAVWLAHDADRDIIYIYDVYRRGGVEIAVHTAAINQRPKLIPVAWPHDMLQREPKTAQVISDIWRKQGANMLGMSARYKDETGGPQGREGVVMEILQRMQTGRFKVFSPCIDWFQEKRIYHRKEGKIVAKNDDIMSATNYACMMRRFAQPMMQVERPRVAVGTAEYDPLGV